MDTKKIVALATEIDSIEKAIKDLTDKLTGQHALLEAKKHDLATEVAGLTTGEISAPKPVRRTQDEVRNSVDRLKIAIKHILKGGKELDKAGILAVAGDVNLKDWEHAIAELRERNEIKRTGDNTGTKYSLA